jgi:hypothetical protein
MAHEFRGSVVVTLPEDADKMAAALSFIFAGWSKFLRETAASEGVKTESDFAVNQTKARAAPGNGAKRGRKAKADLRQDEIFMTNVEK